MAKAGDVSGNRVALSVQRPPPEECRSTLRVEARCLRCGHVAFVYMDAWNLGRRCAKCLHKKGV